MKNKIMSNDVVTTSSKASSGHDAECLVEFSESRVWQRVDDQPTYAEFQDAAPLQSRGLAMDYADAIVRVWRQALNAGQFNTEQPGYILQLEAGDGQFAHWCLDALKSTLNDDEWSRFNPIYLLADSRTERVSACWSHPVLSSWIKTGHLEPVHFNALTHSYIELSSTQLTLGHRSIENPLFVIANGVFSSLPHSFINIHYGHCNTAYVSKQTSASEPIQFHWYQKTDLSPLEQRYVARFDSAYALIPDGAFDCIQHIRQIANHECLWLTSHRGFHLESDLRQQGLPQLVDSPKLFLPVNGHALTWYASEQGGQALHAQRSSQSPLISLIYFGSPRRTSFCDAAQLSTVLPTVRHESAYYANHVADVANPANGGADFIYWLVSEVADDARLLFRYLDELSAALAGLTVQQLSDWRALFNKLWDSVYTFREEHEDYIHLAMIAQQFNAHQLACRILMAVLESNPDNHEARFVYALSCLSRGKIDQTITSLRRITQCDDLESSNLYEEAEGLLNYVVTIPSQMPFEPNSTTARLDSGTLRLMTLSPHHAQDFWLQYRDPSIAVMTALPAFEAIDDLLTWIEQHTQQDNKFVYAVIDSELGFVGVVSASCFEHSAFFYFWIGADYQGQGFGQRAAVTLFKHLSAIHQINAVYTCAFADNSRSISALSELGFCALPDQAIPPDDAYHFYVKALTDSVSPHTDQLHHSRTLQTLLNGINSPIELAEPMSTLISQPGLETKPVRKSTVKEPTNAR